MLKNDFFDIENWSVNNENELRNADELREKLRTGAVAADEAASSTGNGAVISSEKNPPEESEALFRNMDDDEIVEEIPKKGSKLKNVLKVIGIILLVIFVFFILAMFL